jgi:glycosyltransferase involved in cell wall biosynthesis
VIACYNCQEFLGECIESIFKQTLTEWELFLLDDCSSDSTRQVIKHYADMDSRIRPYYFDDNKGPYVRRNFAIENAASDFIMIQDADDIMTGRKCEVFYKEIASDPQLGIVGSFYRNFMEKFTGIECADVCELEMLNDDILKRFVSSRYITWHGSAIIRKSLFETLGLFDRHPYGSDGLWLAKAGEYALHTGRIRIKNIPEYLTFKREHPLSQQGLLPPLDPRGRRAGFKMYWDSKLLEIRSKAQADPCVDIAAELKAVDCSDYIEKFGNLFEQCERQPLQTQHLY